MSPDQLKALADKAGMECAHIQQVVPGRVLYIDGDGLAYYCAGKEGTTIGEAIHRVKEKIEADILACGAESFRILLTGRGSDKGGRYIIATVKEYQGQRSGSRRPDNWEALRTWLESHENALITHDEEADDLFARFAWHADVAPVIDTQDKDMRMVTGAWHLDWQTRHLFYLHTNTFEKVVEDKVYGHKWFWLQMLHGDTADNIPGLPKYINDKGNPALCGPVTAAKLLAETTNNEQAFDIVAKLYRGYYEDNWADMLAEQAMLLWIRHVPAPDAFLGLLPGNGPYSISMAAYGIATKVKETRANYAQDQSQ